MKLLGMLLIAFGTGVYGQRSGSNGNIVYGDGNRARGNDNDIYGSNHIAIGSGNRITGNAVGWVGNGLQMFGVNAHPQFAAGQEVFFADLPNYKGPGAGVATNQQVYNYLDSRWRY